MSAWFTARGRGDSCPPVIARVILDIGGVLKCTPETGWVQWWEERLRLPPVTVHQRVGDIWRAGTVGQTSERDVHDQAAARLGLDAAAVTARAVGMQAHLFTDNAAAIASGGPAV
ncbi:hypothetical protein ACYTFC_31320 [Streptomyces globosus]|uniref:hypothetical protein n=1 Tax=Streptomyces sp. WAC05292 TaxID=2487418 RepID=UPI0037DC69E5